MIFELVRTLVYYCVLPGLALLLTAAIAFYGYLRYLKVQVNQSCDENKKRLLSEGKKGRRSIAFFHPYCNAGGGGEKVLWCMVEALLSQTSENFEIVIYSGEKVPDDQILRKAQDRFNIKFERAPRFLQLSSTKWIHPSTFPVFTIMGQIIGTIKLAIESITMYQPDIFIDSMGLASSYPIVKMLLPRCKVMAYVHYPFVSRDMLSDVLNRSSAFNNSSRVADSSLLSKGKYIYYRLLLAFYAWTGDCCDFAWGNSTWTTNHMLEVWPSHNTPKRQIIKLYPPCNMTRLLQMKLEKKENIMMSFAQYRPEKQQKLQLDILRKVLDKQPDTDLKFYMVGSCRGPEDDALLQELKDYAQTIGVSNRVTFWVNLPYEELMKKFEICSIGIHTMKAEHFGIAIVEMMAAGLVTIAHNSAGPKYDIIKERQSDPVGLLAENADDYVRQVLLCISKEKQGFVRGIAQRARNEVTKFSDEAFKDLFLKDFKKAI